MIGFQEHRAIAQICHEANRALQQILGDVTSPPWDLTDEETQQSAIDGVAYALTGATARDSHENWTRFKREHGWIYGPTKDPELKTHPCLVDYDELPLEQRVKDRLFLGIVRALAKTNG